MKNLFKIGLFLFLFSQFALAGFNKVGTTGYGFLQLPVTARYLSLAETGITHPGLGSEGLFVNPALIALTKERISLNMTMTRYYVDTRHQAMGFTYNLGSMGTVGLQVNYFDFGEIQKTRNPSPSETGSFIDLGMYEAFGLSIGVSYARRLTKKFSFGASLKLVQETIDGYSSRNMIADLGFIYFSGFSGIFFNDLRIGAFLQNFGLDARYLEEKFKMPQTMKLGLSAELFGHRQSATHTTFLAEVAHPNDTNEHLQVGLEQVLLNYISFRFGYKFGFEHENWTFGLGLNFPFKGKKVSFDTAFQKHEFLGQTLRYTLVLEL